MKNLRYPKVKMRLNAFAIALLSVVFCIAGLARATDQPSPKLTLISNVDVFDGKTEKLHKNMHVLVKGNLIETVSNEPLAVIQTDNVTMIDGGGRVLMPGMIDAHWHALFATMPMPKLLQSDLSYLTIVGARANRDALMRGFTTVRDVGGNVFALKQATDEGIIDGPRIYPSGSYISQTGGHGDYNALDGCFLTAGGKSFVGERIEDDGDRHARYAQGQHWHVAFRPGNICCDHAQNECQSHTDRKCDRHAGSRPTRSGASPSGGKPCGSCRRCRPAGPATG